ncbi:MAG: hypothetical protein IJW09_05775 [Clostridia bacterium]|nr:hypothetical protein [Clostridia bacterium]
MTEMEKSGIDRMHERQKERNDKSKYWAALIGQNLSIVVCLAVPAFLIALIWTDLSITELGVRFGLEAILTVFLFIMAEWSAINVGIPSGKLDDEYLAMESSFLISRDATKKKGTLKMSVFCEWQIDEELVAAKKAMCRKLRIDWREYKSVMASMSEAELCEKYGRIRGHEIAAIGKLKPIDLSPELILGERGDGGRGGISVSGDEYVSKQKYGKWNMARMILTVLFMVGISFALTPGVTWGKIVYTVFRLIAVLIRMKMGFDKGAKAYNYIQVKHRKSQIWYMEKYDEFLSTEGLYEAMAEKYGDEVGLAVIRAAKEKEVEAIDMAEVANTDTVTAVEESPA